MQIKFRTEKKDLIENLSGEILYYCIYRYEVLIYNE